MHKSDNSSNFRNEQYINNMDIEFKRMFRAYHKYIAYRNKLLNELTLNEEQIKKIHKIDVKFCKNISKANIRINKEDFSNVLQRRNLQ